MTTDEHMNGDNRYRDALARIAAIAASVTTETAETAEARHRHRLPDQGPPPRLREAPRLPGDQPVNAPRAPRPP